MSCSRLERFNRIISFNLLLMCFGVFWVSCCFADGKQNPTSNILPSGMEEEVEEIFKPYSFGQEVEDGFIFKNIKITEQQISVLLQKDLLNTTIVLKAPERSASEKYPAKNFSIDVTGSTDGIPAAEKLIKQIQKSTFSPWGKHKLTIEADPERLLLYQQYRHVSLYGMLFLLIGLIVSIVIFVRYLKRSHKIAAISLTVLSLLLGLLISEIVLGLLAPDNPPIKLRDDCFPSNPRGYFKEAIVQGHEDIHAFCSFGGARAWQECHEAGTVLNANHLNLLALGDSFTEGLGVFFNDSWPKVLEKISSRKQETRVVNCGRSGADSKAVLERYQKMAAGHQADIVIYAYVLNDAPLLPMEIDAATADISFQGSQIQNTTGLKSFVYNNFNLGRLIISRLKQREIAEATATMYQESFSEANKENLKKHFDTITRLKSACDKQGSKFLLAIFPLFFKLDDYPFLNIHRLIDKNLEARGVEVLDLLDVFKDMNAKKLQVHRLDLHPNELAQKIVARSIYKKLEDLNWLKEESL